MYNVHVNRVVVNRIEHICISESSVFSFLGKSREHPKSFSLGSIMSRVESLDIIHWTDISVTCDNPSEPVVPAFNPLDRTNDCNGITLNEDITLGE